MHFDAPGLRRVWLRVRRPMVAVAVAFGLGATALLATAAPASAADPTVRHCVLQNQSISFTLSPAVHLNTTSQVTVNGSGGQLVTCTGGQTGTLSYSGSGPTNCTASVGTMTLNFTVTWNNGHTSKWTGTAPTNIFTGGTYTGTVTSGDLSGTRAVVLLITPPDIGKCASRAGVSGGKAGGSITFENIV